MLTFENVIKAFADYLEADTEREVVLTKHGYMSMLWDNAARDWSEVTPCETPEEMFDILLDNFQMYQKFLMVGEDGNITPEMEARALELSEPYLERRRILESE